jgi:hypothetical protein
LIFEADPNQTFVIDNDSLTNWLKTSELSIERHDNGMLKTIGASAEDMTGKLIVNTVSGVIKLAQAAVIMAAEVRPEDNPCNEDVLREAALLATKREAVSAATDALDAETKRLKLLGDAVTTFGKAPTEDIQRDLIAQTRVVADRQVALDKVQKVLQSTIDNISLVDTFTWPDDGITFAGTHAYPSVNFLKFLKDPTDLSKSSNNAAIKLRIKPLSTLALSPDLNGKIPATAISRDAKGIRYRNPVSGALEITLCKTIQLTPPNMQESADFCPRDKLDTVTVAQGLVPQLGRLILTPFSNGSFQSNTLKASFTNDGNLQAASVAQKVSRAEVASDTLNQVANNLLQGIKDFRTAEIDTKTSVLKAKTNQLQAQKDYDEAVLALQPSATEENDKKKAIIDSDTALKDALRANIEAGTALEKAKALAAAP